MTRLTFQTLLIFAALSATPSLALAGPPLICHPFETAGGVLLPWGDGGGWNNPLPSYDERRLTEDIARLLTSTAPVLTRMENLRRATIYAGRDRRVADGLLAALLRRARETGSAPALFDAGYLIESYKQAGHLHRGPRPTEDGYGMVVRAITLSGPSPEMEFAAALMREGAPSHAHLRRARASAEHHPVLARNIAALQR